MSAAGKLRQCPKKHKQPHGAARCGAPCRLLREEFEEDDEPSQQRINTEKRHAHTPTVGCALAGTPVSVSHWHRGLVVEAELHFP